MVGFIKGTLLPAALERYRNFVGLSFWARGYFVSTVGRDETVIREYIRHQELEDQRLAQLKLWECDRPPSGGPRTAGPR